MPRLPIILGCMCAGPITTSSRDGNLQVFTTTDYERFRALRMTNVAARFEELIADETNDELTPEQVFFTAVDDALDQRRAKPDRQALPHEHSGDRVRQPDATRSPEDRVQLRLSAMGRERVENPRFIALRSHYGFDSFFCQPGIEGAHAKGGVEGEVGRFRRRHVVPVPDFGSLAELNAFMATADATEEGRRITGRTETVGAAAAREAPGLRALPDEAFVPAQTLSCRVDARARISCASVLLLGAGPTPNSSPG